MLSYPHLTLADLAKMKDENPQFKPVFLMARSVLTGEKHPDFLPQETGTTRIQGARIEMTFLMLNRTQAQKKFGHSTAK